MDVMEKSKLISRSFTNSLGAAVYIAAVAWILFNGQTVFGKIENFWGPFAILLLFVISASAVAALILGKPVLLYLEGEKKAGVSIFLYSLAWLALFVVIVFLIRPW